MTGEFGNRDDDIAVKAALKGLNWHDQMEMARALRKERAQHDAACGDTSAADNLQPIFKQLKRTRSNTAAEATTKLSAQEIPPAFKHSTEKATDRGVRFEAAVSGGMAGPNREEHRNSSSDHVESSPNRVKTSDKIQDGICGKSEHSEPAPDPESALIPVSRVTDGEVLDQEPDYEPNTIVVRPAPEKNTRWRLAIGFGFGVGLSVLLGVALLGSMLGFRGNTTSPLASEVPQANMGLLASFEGNASVPGRVSTASLPLTVMTVSVAAPVAGMTPPTLGPSDTAGVAPPAMDRTADLGTYDETTAASLHHLAAPTGPENPPIIPVQVPRPRPSPTEDRPKTDIATLLPPDNAGLPGAAGLIAVLNAPAKLSGDKVDTAVTSLRKTGLSLRSVNRVNFKVGSDHIRFYHQEDAALAASIADHMGAQARDFTNYRPQPPAGSIEIYLAGNGQPTKRKEAATVEPVAALKSLRDSIFRTLRP